MGFYHPQYGSLYNGSHDEDQGFQMMENHMESKWNMRWKLARLKVGIVF